MSPPRSARGPTDPRRAIVRLAYGIATSAVVALALPGTVSLAERLVAAWDVGAAVMCAVAWYLITRSDADETRQRASAEDPGRTFVWLLTVLSAAAGLFAATVLLHAARHATPAREARIVALCIAAVVVSWVLTHTSYTFRYAHLFYRSREGDPAATGLAFPGQDPPDDMDFAYFAFTIGMCFQVSDVAVPGRTIRRTVLSHALIAFGYNTAIVALAFNLVSGLLT